MDVSQLHVCNDQKRITASDRYFCMRWEDYFKRSILLHAIMSYVLLTQSSNTKKHSLLLKSLEPNKYLKFFRRERLEAVMRQVMHTKRREYTSFLLISASLRLLGFNFWIKLRKQLQKGI